MSRFFINYLDCFIYTSIQNPLTTKDTKVFTKFTKNFFQGYFFVYFVHTLCTLRLK